MLKVIGGLVGVLLAAGVMVTSQGMITEGADTTTVGAESQNPEEVKPEWTPYAAAIWVQHNTRVRNTSYESTICFLNDPCSTSLTGIPRLARKSLPVSRKASPT